MVPKEKGDKKPSLEKKTREELVEHQIASLSLVGKKKGGEKRGKKGGGGNGARKVRFFVLFGLLNLKPLKGKKGKRSRKKTPPQE